MESSASPNPRPVGPSPIEAVLLIDRLERPPGHRVATSSLPGHLIQLTLRGRTRHEANGRRYVLRAGDLIWYHEDETVRVAVEEAYAFYTLNFIAPRLAPPPFERRVRHVGAPVRRAFTELLRVWRDSDAPPASRDLSVHSRLTELLHQITRADGENTAAPITDDPLAQLWWRLETLLRRDLSQPITLDGMADLIGRSPATIARSCRVAVGSSPMKRIKHVRMSMARGWVQRSDQTISQIAEQVGFPRVHEFSRDYRKHFGKPPTQDRRDTER